MAIEDVTLPGAGSKVAVDRIGASRLVQVLKLAVGDEGVLALIAAGAGAVTAGTLRATLASDDPAVTALGAILAEFQDDIPADVEVVSSEYEVVEASQTDQMLGTTGAIGDKLEALLVIPTSTTVGAISIEDGSTNTVVYAGGTVSADLKPFPIPLFGIASESGGWEITTGAGARVIAFGRFT
ncbi:hypothetical protein [Phenylobacterium koreense]|uniref:Uncharacterized protein n=1 Tax=Phenylobacterium koreense TaxID=266125 RepID=A0ABV2EJN9_9CAUL